VMLARRPHPSALDHDLVELRSKVRHEFMVPRDASDEEVLQLVVGYLLEYEAVYPETEEVDAWAGLLELLPEGEE